MHEEKVLNRLSKDEYLATFDAPMRFIDTGDDSVPPVSIGNYCEICFKSENIPTNREDIQIHYVYANNTKDYCHVLLNWGVENVYLVIVTKPQEQKIYGHYLLDLNKEYGLYEAHSL